MSARSTRPVGGEAIPEDVSCSNTSRVDAIRGARATELGTKLRSLRKKNRITLFFPSSNPGSSPPIPNLGIGYIGTVLHRHGHAVQCVDGDLICPDITTEQPHLAQTVLERSLRAIEETRPDILAVGCWTTNSPLAAELIAGFAQRSPDVLIVLGGYQATFLPRFIMAFLPQLDILVHGEGEQTTLELVQAIERGESLERVAGISYRNGDQIVTTPPRDLIADLDELPFIDYSLFVGFGPEACPSLRILTSRGCPFRCTFCSCRPFWRRTRTRRVEHIGAEIRSLREMYHVRSFGLCDDLFALDKTRVLDFCRMLRREHIDISWSFNARIDSLDTSLIEMLLGCGVTQIFVGLESLTVESLRFIGEKDPARYVRKAEAWIEYCSSHRVPCKISTIVGFPNETEADIENTVSLVLRCVGSGLKAYTGLLVCYPGTPLWSMYEANDIRLVRVMDHRLRRNSSGFFADKYEHLPEFVPNAWMIENEHVPPPRMEQLLRSWL